MLSHHESRGDQNGCQDMLCVSTHTTSYLCPFISSQCFSILLTWSPSSFRQEPWPTTLLYSSVVSTLASAEPSRHYIMQSIINFPLFPLVSNSCGLSSDSWIHIVDSRVLSHYQSYPFSSSPQTYLEHLIQFSKTDRAIGSLQILPQN